MAPLSTELRARIISEARKYVGIPFKFRARGPKYIDCAGLIVAVARQLGIENDFTTYGARPSLGSVLEVMRANFDQKPLRDIEDGDMFVMGHPDFLPSHVGFFSTFEGQCSIIHSYNLIGKCVETHLDEHWKKMLIAAFQFRQA